MIFITDLVYEFYIKTTIFGNDVDLTVLIWYNKYMVIYSNTWLVTDGFFVSKRICLEWFEWYIIVY